jgi:putative transposase
MTKISVETYINAVECYLTGKDSKRRVGKRYGIEDRAFRVLVAIYEQHGREGLIAPPRITGEFRVNLVEWKQGHNASITETCAHFAFRSVSSIGIWERIYFTEGKQALLAMRQGVKPHRSRKCTTTAETPGKREFIVADTERRLKKIGSLEKATKRQISEVIIALRANHKLADLIDALPISMSVFQYWQKKLSQPDPDEELKYRIALVFEAHNGNYGIPRVTPEVRAMYAAEGRQQPNHRRIQRVMHEMNVHCQKYGKRTRKYDSSKGPSGKKVKNKLNRRFMTDRPLQKLVCDVTELQAGNGEKVYLKVIKDLYSNRILEWELSTHPMLKFSLAPLKRLVAALPHTGYQITLHTDQGWQYQHRAWRQLLHNGCIRQSMSHRSTCLDNAACETVFNKLKAEMTPSEECADANVLMTTIDEWINYYNEDRIQTRLGSIAPRAYEQRCQIKYQFYIQPNGYKVKESV